MRVTYLCIPAQMEFPSGAEPAIDKITILTGQATKFRIAASYRQKVVSIQGKVQAGQEPYVFARGVEEVIHRIRDHLPGSHNGVFRCGMDCMAASQDPSVGMHRMDQSFQPVWAGCAIVIQKDKNPSSCQPGSEIAVASYSLIGRLMVCDLEMISEFRGNSFHWCR